MHFTYKSPDSSKLSQGDILVKTDEIKLILSQAHPHYLKDDYLYLIVLTQSCDLHHGNSRYITLAAVRPLELLIARELQNYQSDELEKKSKILDTRKKDYLSRFIEHLLKNNEPEYFYLNEDVSMGLSESCVAFLRLSIAIKYDLHYSACLRAKKLELQDIFKAKLGWLVGNMYSRVGTEEWVPEYKTESEFIEIIQQIIETNCILIDNVKDVLKELRGKYTPIQLSTMNLKELQQEIEMIKIPTRKDKFLERFTDVLSGIEFSSVDQSLKKKIVNEIKNDPGLSALLK